MNTRVHCPREFLIANLTLLGLSDNLKGFGLSPLNLDMARGERSFRPPGHNDPNDDHETIKRHLNIIIRRQFHLPNTNTASKPIQRPTARCESPRNRTLSSLGEPLFQGVLTQQISEGTVVNVASSLMHGNRRF